MDQDSFMPISRYMAAALCLLGSLTGAAHGSDINGEASFISFGVPDSVGTYPMGINSSMTVTGYYLMTNREANGFIRTADGTIATFSIAGAVWTRPVSINTAGDITGSYGLTSGQPRGFLRYADGRTITFYPPPQSGDAPEASPVSINDFDDIAGTIHTSSGSRSFGFTRSRAAVYNPQISFADATVVTALNWTGSVVGYATSFSAGDQAFGFGAHPDGYSFTFTVSLAQSDAACTTAATFPMAINAGGTIAGWYYANCPTNGNGGFVRSSQGEVIVFQLPGTIGQDNISIDDAGDITGAYTDNTGTQHGFVRNPYGTITTFDPPEGQYDANRITQPTSINNAGAITGFFSYAGPTGFIRVPPTGTSAQQ
jgi:hypothetical protein